MEQDCAYEFDDNVWAIRQLLLSIFTWYLLGESFFFLFTFLQEILEQENRCEDLGEGAEKGNDKYLISL